MRSSLLALCTLCALAVSGLAGSTTAHAGKAGAKVRKARRAVKIHKLLGTKRSPTTIRDGKIKQTVTVRKSGDKHYMVDRNSQAVGGGHERLRIVWAGGRKVAIGGRSGADGGKEYVVMGGKNASGFGYTSLKAVSYANLLIGKRVKPTMYNGDVTSYYLVSPQTGKPVNNGIYEGFRPLRGTEFLAGETIHGTYALLNKSTGEHLGTFDSIKVRGGKIVTEDRGNKFLRNGKTGELISRAWNK